MKTAACVYLGSVLTGTQVCLSLRQSRSKMPVIMTIIFLESRMLMDLLLPPFGDSLVKARAAFTCLSLLFLNCFFRSLHKDGAFDFSICCLMLAAITAIDCHALFTSVLTNKY